MHSQDKQVSDSAAGDGVIALIPGEVAYSKPGLSAVGA